MMSLIVIAILLTIGIAFTKWKYGKWMLLALIFVGVVVIWTTLWKIIGALVFSIIVPFVFICIVFGCLFINKRQIDKLWEAIKRSL